MGQDELDLEFGVPGDWDGGELSIKVYIDDMNNLEKVRTDNAIVRISEDKQVVLAHAIKSQENFDHVKGRAEEIKMKVNSAKTQLLCVSGNMNNNTKSYIRTEGTEIQSGESLKILGFWFGNRPNVHVHLGKMLTKFKSRLWTLRHLQKSGMTQNDLLIVYRTVLRPVLDFAVPAYHTLMTATEREEVEKLQRRALKIVFGIEGTYKEHLEKARLDTLEDRREDIFKKFAIASEKNERYSEEWFPKKEAGRYNLREKNRYIEYPIKTERMRKNPITCMRKLLNNM